MEKFVVTYLQTLVAALVVMGVFYLLIWVLLSKFSKNRKIQLSKRAGWTQIKEEIIASAVSLLGGTAFSLIIFSMKDAGNLKFYENAGKYGIWYEVLVVAMMIFVTDAWFYWLHRFMHRPSVYKYVHALHHKSLDVNPFTSNSFHVIEAIALTVWILPFLYFVPVSPVALGVVQALGTFNNRIWVMSSFQSFSKFHLSICW
jgi:ring-1,2-phenylacetyl-CoA epoxidase subunit PaaE